ARADVHLQIAVRRRRSLHVRRAGTGARVVVAVAAADDERRQRAGCIGVFDGDGAAAASFVVRVAAAHFDRAGGRLERRRRDPDRSAGARAIAAIDTVGPDRAIDGELTRGEADDAAARRTGVRTAARFLRPVDASVGGRGSRADVANDVGRADVTAGNPLIRRDGTRIRGAVTVAGAGRVDRAAAGNVGRAGDGELEARAAGRHGGVRDAAADEHD